MNEEQTRQFFASKPNPPTRIHMGGKKLHFKEFPIEEQIKIKKRLAEKDEIMGKAQRGILPGIKIDGKEVTKENLHDFEISKPGEISKSGKEYRESHKAEIEKIEREVKKAIKKTKKTEIKQIKKEEKKKGYTTDQLKSIAESKGIKGLRAIGRKLGLKFRGIKEAIKEIMEVQR